MDQLEASRNSGAFRTAVSDAKLAMLDAQGFHSIAQRFRRRSEAALRIVQYANQFVEDLNKSEFKTDLG